MNFIYRSLQFGFMHIWPALVLIFCATFLPAGQLGAAAIFLSVATLFRPLVGLSLGRTAIRNAGAAFAEGGDARAQQVIALATRLGFAMSALGLVFVVVAVPVANRIYGLEISARAVAFGALFIYAFGLTEFLDGIMRAQGHFRALASAVIASRLFGILLFAVVLPFVPQVEALFACLALAEVSCVVLLARHFLPSFRRHAAPSLLSRDSASLLKSCLPVIINALSVYLYARAMVMVAGLHDSGAALGGFEMAVQLTNLPMALTIVCATVMSPAIARLHARGTVRSLETASAAASQAAAFSVWANMLAAGFLMVVGPMAILWFFPAIPGAAVVLAIIAPLVALKAYAQILSGELAIATGTASIAARITIVYAVLTVALGYALSAVDGVRGAAIAMLIVHTLAVWTTVRVLGRETGLKIRYRGKSSLTSALVATVPTALLVFALRDHPAAATLAGAATFLLLVAATQYLSVRLGWGLHEPLVDGWRMLRNKNVSAEDEAYELFDDESRPEPDAKDYRNALVRLIGLKSPDGLAFWTGGNGAADVVPPQDHADIVYSLYLIGEGERIDPGAAKRFAKHLAGLPLYGKTRKGLNAHVSAYLLATIRILVELGKLNSEDDIEEIYQDWQQDLLFDSLLLPRWPRMWSHHIWRVSHWIGGSSSILLHLAASGRVAWATKELLQQVLDASERHILDHHTGLLRTYRSKLLHRGFRKLYQALHDPDIADLGGIVHLLWVYHAIDRRYVGSAALSAAASRELRREPFMESVPYCLDFDIIQLKRTAEFQFDKDTVARADRFIDDTLAFFRAPLSSTYTLHKLPGALAALHECAFITGQEKVRGLEVERTDIIRVAYWL